MPVVGHVGPALEGKNLSAPHALAALSALGQTTRLDIFRLLMRNAPTGLPAGVIAEKLDCPHNTLSSHLGILARSGLVEGHREGRSIIYRANVDTIKSLIGYLIDDCCKGHPELCQMQQALRVLEECGTSAKRSKKTGRT